MKFVALIALIAFAPVATHAQEYLPKWHMTGNEACYDLEGAKALLKADLELKTCNENYKIEIPKLQLAVKDLKLALDLSQKHAEIWSDQAVKYNTEATKRIVDLYSCEAKLNSGPSWGWLVAGGLAAVLLGVGVGAWAKP